MQRNYESGQNPADTPNLRSNEGRPFGPCPTWCVDHDRMDVGHRDEAVTHLGPVRKSNTPREYAPTAQVQLSQVEYVNTGERLAVVIRVDDDVMVPAEAVRNANELAAVLAEEVARAGLSVD